MNEGTTKTGTLKGKKNIMQLSQEQQKLGEVVQGTTPSPNSQEPGLTKRPSTHMGGAGKKMKAQRTPPEYTITEDDAEMIAQMVQDRTSEDFENVVCHRDIIQEEMEDMQEFLKHIGEAQAPSNNIGARSSTFHTGEELEARERDTVNTILQLSETFHITPNMLHMDEIMGKTPLKD
jgi:hypothetical protein